MTETASFPHLCDALDALARLGAQSAALTQAASVEALAPLAPIRTRGTAALEAFAALKTAHADRLRQLSTALAHPNLVESRGTERLLWEMRTTTSRILRNMEALPEQIRKNLSALDTLSGRESDLDSQIASAELNIRNAGRGEAILRDLAALDALAKALASKPLPADIASPEPPLVDPDERPSGDDPGPRSVEGPAVLKG